MATSLAVEGTRRIFPHAYIDRFTGSGGGDVLCIRIGAGGFRLDGATRVCVGIGARIRSHLVGVQGALVGGVMSGRQGYSMDGAASDQVIAPHVGATGTAVLLNYLLLNSAVHRTRLARTETLPGRTGSITSREWSPMATVQVGASFSLGAR